MNKNESNAAKKVRALLLGAREALVARFGEKKAKKILIGVPVTLGVLILLFVLILLIPIRQIEVVGDIEMFNEGDIVEASGVGEGDLMFMHPGFTISGAIREKMPLVGEVNVTKNPFGKLTIEVKVGDVDFYTKIGEKYYAIDKNLRVLDESTKRSKYSAYGAAYIILPEVREPQVGEYLVFYDTVEETDTEGELLYEVKDPSVYDYVSNFLTALKESESGFLEQTDGIILDEKFDITLIYSMKYQVKFGSASNLDAKFRVFFAILNEGTAVKMDKAVIDLTDPSKATSREDTELDFSEFDD